MDADKDSQASDAESTAKNKASTKPEQRNLNKEASSKKRKSEDGKGIGAKNRVTRNKYPPLEVVDAMEDQFELNNHQFESEDIKCVIRAALEVLNSSKGLERRSKRDQMPDYDSIDDIFRQCPTHMNMDKIKVYSIMAAMHGSFKFYCRTIKEGVRSLLLNLDTGEILPRNPLANDDVRKAQSYRELFKPVIENFSSLRLIFLEDWNRYKNPPYKNPCPRVPRLTVARDTSSSRT